MAARPLRLTLRYFDGCPSWQVARERLEAILREGGLSGVQLLLERVDTTVDAERLRFVGSPSILINGADPFAVGGEPVGLACRVYRTPDGLAGSPTTEQLRAALHAASASTSGAPVRPAELGQRLDIEGLTDIVRPSLSSLIEM